MSSRGVNKVILVGNLGDAPEVRHTPSGAAVAQLSLATTDTWKDNAGNRQEKTEWHRVVFFNRLAEIAGEYLKKGSQIYVEGKLRTKKWQDKNGHDRYTTEIHGNDLQMLGNHSADATTSANDIQGSKAEGTEKTDNFSQANQSSQNFDDFFGDELPF